MSGIDQYTKLMLHMDDSSFIDVCGHTVTNNGVTLDTANYKFGNSSAKFNGTSNYLNIMNNEDFNFTNGDFTIDAWVYLTSSTSYRQVIGKWGSTGSNNGWDVRVVNNGGNFAFIYSTTGSNYVEVDSGVKITLSTLTHIAVSRKDSNLYMFINGTLVKTYTIGNVSIYNSTLNLHVGEASNYFYSGSIDELRLSKGIARWTSNFTPLNMAYNKTLYLIKQNLSYYSINSTYYDSVTNHNFTSLTLSGGTTPNKSDIETFGFYDLNVLGNSMTVASDIFKPIDKLENNFDIKMYK